MAWELDPFLQAALRRLVPDVVLQEFEPDLRRFGERLLTEVEPLADAVNACDPRLRRFDAAGERVDAIITSPAWRQIRDIAAAEGLVALPYERAHGQFSRVHQMAKLFMGAPLLAFFTCPIAMTDGAARVLECCEHTDLRATVLPRLLSRSTRPGAAWVSGQWMTERAGGSDVVGATETVARPLPAAPHDSALPAATHELHGLKWFTSAIDGDVALALAKLVDPASGRPEARPTLFFVPLHLPASAAVAATPAAAPWNGIKLRRLKRKLGTRQVPTAEAVLRGCRAVQLSPPARGVPAIAPMVNVTRVHNAVGAAAGMRRMQQLARAHARARRAFGRPLAQHPLHVRTLAEMEVQTRAATLLALEAAWLLGRVECGAHSGAVAAWRARPAAQLPQLANVSDDDAALLLRLLTPVVKLFTAKLAVAQASEGLECFGGEGYVEASGLPRLLRDAQVLPIWEGTTNVLALDVLRVLRETGGRALRALERVVHARAAAAAAQGRGLALRTCAPVVGREMSRVTAHVQLVLGGHVEPAVAAALGRELGLSLGRLAAAGALLEHALWSEGVAAPAAAAAVDAAALERWCAQPLCVLPHPSLPGNASAAVEGDAALGMGDLPTARL